jgi:membrane-associated phospholipid phosphatase
VRLGAIRAAAWAALGVGVAAPVLRRRLPAPPAVAQATAFAAPVALCVAVPRSRRRDVATCALQMWAYLALYKTPHDDAAQQARQVRIDYPIVLDRALGLGELPTVRLQRALAEADRWTALDRVLVWSHWTWFFVPHGTLLYIMFRHPERFDRAAVMTYAVFDLGASVYWVLPTAPPWYAATVQGEVADAPDRGEALAALAERVGDPGRHGADSKAILAVRRMMVEYGEHFWKERWGPLYEVLGGNPLAAMPSLHFATSLMAAQLLSECGPGPGALGWAYALTLGFSLVYLGEHYVVDLLGGAAVTAVVRRFGPRAEPALRAVSGAIGQLERLAASG